MKKIIVLIIVAAITAFIVFYNILPHYNILLGGENRSLDGGLGEGGSNNMTTDDISGNVTVVYNGIPYTITAVNDHIQYFSYSPANMSEGTFNALARSNMTIGNPAENYANFAEACSEDTPPEYINAGTYYYAYCGCVEENGTNYYKQGLCIFTISQSDAGLILKKFDQENQTYSEEITNKVEVEKGETIRIKIENCEGNVSVNTSGDIVTASISGDILTIQAGQTAGTVEITVTREAGNYTNKTKTFTLEVMRTEILDSMVNVSDTEWTYDGSPHRITVTSTLENATIKYGTADGTYNLTQSPTYTNANEGGYTIYYEVTKDGYYPKTNFAKLIIHKANGEITLSGNSGRVYKGARSIFTVNNVLGNGSLSVESSNTSIATASIMGETVTISGISEGTTSIIVTSAESENYKQATAVYEVTVEQSLEITDNMVIVEGYEADYDGQAHGINVTSSLEGATIKYGVVEGTYDLTRSPVFTNASEEGHIVYYEVTKEGYIPKTGSARVIIHRVNATLTLNPNQGTILKGESITAFIDDAASDNLKGFAFEPGWPFEYTHYEIVSSNENIASAEQEHIGNYQNNLVITAGQTAGQATITVTRPSYNYNSATATFTVNVVNPEITDDMITVEGYEGNYDGQAHGINVTSSLEGATIKYGVTAGTYNLTESPKYVNANEAGYTVYYEVSKSGYTSKTGSARVKIHKINSSIELSEYFGTVANGNQKRFYILEKIGDGNLRVESSNLSKASATLNGLEVLVSGNERGNARITITISETQNYKSAAAVYDLTIEKRVIKLEIVTPPDKTSYKIGDTFNTTGMLVEAIYDDGTRANVYNYNVLDGATLTTNQEFVTITYTENDVTVSAKQRVSVSGVAITVPKTKTLNKIVVTKYPDKITYYQGENFDPAGMEITAIYDDGTREKITGFIVADGNNLNIGRYYVLISYTENGVTRITKQQVLVMPLEEPEVDPEEPENPEDPEGTDDPEDDEEIIEIGYNIEDSFITNVSPKTPISDFKNILVNNTNYRVSVIKNDAEIDSGYVETGMLATIKEKNGKILTDKNGNLLIYEIAVKGDINGDGKANIFDSMLIKAYIAETREFSNLEFIAADINDSKTVNFRDLRLLLYHRAEVRGYNLDYQGKQ